jgi:hypothetical protein
LAIAYLNDKHVKIGKAFQISCLESLFPFLLDSGPLKTLKGKLLAEFISVFLD